MVNKCAAPNCSVRYHLSSFHFPKDKEMYDRWKKAVPRDNWVPTANSVLCEKHFLPTDFKEERVDSIFALLILHLLVPFLFLCSNK